MILRSLSLVTGYAGVPHVTSSQQGAYNAATFSAGKYVLNIGNLFAYELISNNLIKVKDGYAIDGGRLMGMENGDYEEVSIDNGLQGVKRSDLIVMRYERNVDTGIETAKMTVIKGTSGDAYNDPEYTAGNILNGDAVDDFLLYRVNINGLSIESVEQLFKVKGNLEEIIATMNNVLETHTHDGRYYTEPEIDTKFNQVNSDLNNIKVKASSSLKQVIVGRASNTSESYNELRFEISDAEHYLFRIHDNTDQLIVWHYVNGAYTKAWDWKNIQSQITTLDSDLKKLYVASKNANSDLNKLTQKGFYEYTTNAVANLPAYDSDNAFRVIVMGEPTNCIQIYIGYAGDVCNGIYMRGLHAGAWKGWERLDLGGIKSDLTDIVTTVTTEVSTTAVPGSDGRFNLTQPTLSGYKVVTNKVQQIKNKANVEMYEVNNSWLDVVFTDATSQTVTFIVEWLMIRNI